MMPAQCKLIPLSLCLYYKLIQDEPQHSHIQAQLSSRMKRAVSVSAIALIFLVFASSYIESATAGSAVCDAKCGVRCAKASVRDGCLKYCGICCEECHCVPSGTYGNKDECPCYRDKTTGTGKRKRPKCP